MSSQKEIKYIDAEYFDLPQWVIADILFSSEIPYESFVDALYTQLFHPPTLADRSTLLSARSESKAAKNPQSNAAKTPQLYAQTRRPITTEAKARLVEEHLDFEELIEPRVSTREELAKRFFLSSLPDPALAERIPRPTHPDPNDDFNRAELAAAYEKMRKQAYKRSQKSEKERYTLEGVCFYCWASYNNLKNKRLRNLPPRSLLIYIADYLGCTLEEKNHLLSVAKYAPFIPSLPNSAEMLPAQR